MNGSKINLTGAAGDGLKVKRVPVSLYLKMAGWAYENIKPGAWALDDRKLLFLHAMGAGVMRRLSAAWLWFEGKNENAISQGMKCITAGFGLPFLLAYQLCLNLTFNLGQFIILRAHFHRLKLDVDEFLKHLAYSTLDFDLIGEFKSSLGHFRRNICSAQDGGDFSHHAETVAKRDGKAMPAKGEQG